MAARIANGASPMGHPSEIAVVLKECQSAVDDVWSSVVSGLASQDAGVRASAELRDGCIRALRELSKSRASIAAIWVGTRAKPGKSSAR